MVRLLLSITLAFSLWISVAAVGKAASFDCNKANTEAEMAICTNPELSALDELMSTVWRDEARTHLEAAIQKKWLNKRDECATSKRCLLEAFIERLKEKPFSLGSFRLIRLHDTISNDNDFHIIRLVKNYAYNSEIIIESISSKKLKLINWIVPKFNEELVTCGLHKIHEADILLQEKTSVLGWTNLLSQTSANGNAIEKEISIFTKWAGHGDQSQKILYHLRQGKMAPIRGEVDNCADQKIEYAQISVQ